MSDLTVPFTGVTPKLTHLFSPVQINKLVLNNRSMMSSIHLNLEELGHDEQFERMAKFYALRARHGAGLIVTAGCAPDAIGAFIHNGFSLKNESEVRRHRWITDAVHAEGGRIALQIMHFGREAVHGEMVSASDCKLASSIFKPRGMEEAEILKLIEDYAICAGRAIEAGYDAIELIFSQGFLVHQFLAPATNKRTDRWGGSLENRMRLAIEITRVVRARVGLDFPIIFRIPCMDLQEGGLEAKEVLTLIAHLKPYGIDLLSVSIGWHDSYVPTIAMVAPRAAFASATRMVRSRFPDLKLCASNRINDPRVAEQLIMDGVADMVAMARPFLADAAIIGKARVNDFDNINPCIACNQNCLDYVFAGEPVGCSVNPQAVRAEEGVYAPLSKPMHIAVVGGGIAGMGAALFLAHRGAKVDLFEETTNLGGQLQLAIAVPDKTEFAGTVNYYRQALLRIGVSIHLAKRFDATAEEARRFDHVIVATGCTPRKPDLVPGIDLPHVRQYTDVLGDHCPIKFPVVVIGGGGVGCDVAKYVIKRSDEIRQGSQKYLTDRVMGDSVKLQLDSDLPRTGAVTIVQRSSRKFAMRLGRTTRWIQMEDMQRMGVVMRNRLEILRITEEGVEIRDKKTNQVEMIPALTVILAAGHTPRVDLVGILTERSIPHSVIGSASTEGSVDLSTNISSALGSAYTTAMSLGIHSPKKEPDL